MFFEVTTPRAAQRSAGVALSTASMFCRASLAFVQSGVAKRWAEGCFADLPKNGHELLTALARPDEWLVKLLCSCAIEARAVQNSENWGGENREQASERISEGFIEKCSYPGTRATRSHIVSARAMPLREPPY